MIAYISGIIYERREQSVIVMVGGIGYELYCPTSTLNTLNIGTQTSFSTRFIVREDAQFLFGFQQSETLILFDLLISVNGVGPKLALAILSSLSETVVIQAILTADTQLLSSVSGVGKKTAERIILELKNKIPASLLSDTNHVVTPSISCHQDAIDALLALGFKEVAVRSIILELSQNDPDASTDSLIRKALGKLR